MAAVTSRLSLGLAQKGRRLAANVKGNCPYQRNVIYSGRESEVVSIKWFFGFILLATAIGCYEAPPQQPGTSGPTTAPEKDSQKPPAIPEMVAEAEKSTPADLSEETATDEVKGKDQGPVPEAGHPLLDDEKFKKEAILGRLLAKKRCIICHKVEGKGGILSPPMEEVSLGRLTKMKTYQDHVNTLKSDDPQRFESKKEVLEGILAEKDLYKQMRMWLTAYLRQPTFDNGMAKMQKQPLKNTEIRQLTAYVITVAKASSDKANKPD